MRTKILDEFIPTYRLHQIDRIHVKATTENAWNVVRNIDIYELSVSKFLFELRTLPDKFAGKKVDPVLHSRIDDFTAEKNKAFRILHEEKGKEIIVGAIGKFWRFTIPFLSTNSDHFKTFSETGFCKVAWSLRVDSDGEQGSWITWELRVTATDDMSWKKFRLYWIIIGQFSHFLRKAAMSMFGKKLGLVHNDDLKLAGDEILKDPLFLKTMSIMIEKNQEEVWPWLVQMGCRRAGWYSIDWLDNGRVKSSETILPQFQAINVGDTFPWTPKSIDGFVVQSIDVNHSLVLGSAPPEQIQSDLPFADTWSFVLMPAGPSACELHTRVRVRFHKSVKMIFMGPVYEVVHYIMQNAQLKNIKTRVEKS